MRVGQSNSNPVQSGEISSAKSGKAGAARKTDRPGSTSHTADAVAVSDSGSARTEISSRARDMATAKAVATSAPDVREEKIAELKRRIAEGKYNVDAHAIADRMVDEHLKTADMG